MNAFRPKSVVIAQRPTGAEIDARLRDATAEIAPAVVAEKPAKRTREQTVQINFKASSDLAKTLDEMARDEGSTRKVIARLLKADGKAVLERDLNAQGFRRRYS